MPLVSYSDSEGSDTEAPLAPAPKTASKRAFQKATKSDEPRKIKVDLPSIQPEAEQRDAQDRPAKRARTAGAFSGFNSLLPAPKRVAAPKAGVSLKTSSEAAFSRAPEPVESDGWDEVVSSSAIQVTDMAAAEQEPRSVGKATKFKPLSVANKKKKDVKKTKLVEGVKEGSINGGSTTQSPAKTEDDTQTAMPPPKAKRSLFSVPQAEAATPDHGTTGDYESMTTTHPTELRNTEFEAASHNPAPPNPNSLQSLTSDLNLTPAQRRQIFGRNAKKGDDEIDIAHFNMDSEYAANEQLRQAGETVEHRAVKTIAPGKHSLQQLVNNARSQQGAMEDKWAKGRRDRGESGGKYGWGT